MPIKLFYGNIQAIAPLQQVLQAENWRVQKAVREALAKLRQRGELATGEKGGGVQTGDEGATNMQKSCQFPDVYASDVV